MRSSVMEWARSRLTSCVSQAHSTFPSWHASSRRYQALIALGAVIRGQTPHFDFVAGECAGGIARIALETGVPIAFGVLTTDTVEQAVDRAGGKAGNKGADAALVALEVANLLRRLDT